MGKWLLIASGVIVIAAVIAVFIGQARESAKANELVENLIQSASRPITGTVDFDTFSELPSPVARYFRHVLTEGPELNSGALHRYLAEAVWFPTALLPQSGVVWTPIDDRSALATLTDRGTTVSLEFRFNGIGEVTSIYSPGRFGRFDGGYKQVPWEGHFRDYQVRADMRVPMYGEVGWYVDETLQIVWKGDLIDVQYELGP